ncbi:MAG: FKBP-type peptidyl-prolyl cis-trans isomerase [Rhabdochlamydiaceae bacterium]|nr:FKBP-type peptidyl-prolyl cis-trans isomerase [Rhabdochlamydiaceae bacterium]
MRKLIATLFTLTSLGALQAEEAAEAQTTDISKISEAFGHMIGKNLDNIGVEFDIAQVIKGLQDASAGKNSPMSEAECIQAISAVQEKLFKDQALSNLAEADQFLSENTKSSNIVSLENGKVQYKIEQAGSGASVEDHFAPLIRYTGKYLNGTVFGEAKEEEKISLDEIIPGLKAGLIGMKEGEKRTVYIHPDFAYGTSGYLPPNSLLTFEIEVVKANAPQADTVDSITTEPAVSHNKEIAETETHVR